MKTLKSNISEACKVKVDCLKDLESDSYDKNDMKEKVNDLVRLHEAVQEKLKTASYLEQIQILTLVPECTVFECLVWTLHEIKKVVGISAKPAPKKGKNITTKTLNLVTNVYEDDKFSRYVPEKKDYVSASKVVHKSL